MFLFVDVTSSQKNLRLPEVGFWVGQPDVLRVCRKLRLWEAHPSHQGDRRCLITEVGVALAL